MFPLPEDAAVDALHMIVGDREIEGVIQKKEEARKTYEKAAREGRRASLVEQERPNLFTTKVANLGPHQTLSVRIEYQEGGGGAGCVFDLCKRARGLAGGDLFELIGFDLVENRCHGRGIARGAGEGKRVRRRGRSS